MLGAVALYAGLMTLVWSVRFRREHMPFRRVFLPSAAQVREHAAEYSLAVATSLLLMLSLMAKHSTVEHLKAALNTSVLENAQDCRDTLDLGHVFPLHACPEQLGAIGVRNLLQLTADQGQTSEAQFVVERLYRDEGRNNRLPLPWITDGRLRLACLLLLLGHVLWLVRGRSSQLAAAPDDSGMLDYSEAARPLLALSVCAALLLLAAPAGLPTPENVASATIASIQDDAAHETLSEDVARTRAQVEKAFESQRHNLSLLNTNEDPGGSESIFSIVGRVSQRVETIDGTFRAEDDGLRQQIESLDETHRRDIEALRTAQNGDRDRLMAVDTATQSQAAAIRDLQDNLTRAQSSLQAALSGQQMRLNELQNALAQSRGQIEQATEIAQSTRDSLNGRVNELVGRVGQIQVGLQQVNAQIAQQVQSAREDLANDIRAEAQARGQLANRIAALEQGGQNANAANGNLNALAQRIGSVARDLEILTARVNGYHSGGAPPVVTRVPGARDSGLRLPQDELTSDVRRVPGGREAGSARPQDDATPAPGATTRVPDARVPDVRVPVTRPQSDETPGGNRRAPGVRDRVIRQPQTDSGPVVR
jgi:hypothetical protein